VPTPVTCSSRAVSGRSVRAISAIFSSYSTMALLRESSCSKSGVMADNKVYGSREQFTNRSETPKRPYWPLRRLRTKKPEIDIAPFRATASGIQDRSGAQFIEGRSLLTGDLLPKFPAQ
jgi:hypothetical protein